MLELKAGKVKDTEMSGNNCLDCGEQKKSRTGVRCASCAMKYRWAHSDDKAVCRSTAERSEAAKKAHRDDPTIRIRQAEAARQAYCDDPILREKAAEKTKEAYRKDPSLREKQSVIMKERYEDPAAREKLSVIMKERYKDPAKRENMIAARWTHRHERRTLA